MGKSLRSKIKVYFLILFAVLFLSQFILRQMFIYPRIEQTEKRLDENSIHVFRSFLNEELSSLEEKAIDYAFWDDTYEFIENKNEKFIKSNFLKERYKNLDIDAVAIYDKEFNFIWNGFYHSDTDSVITQREFFASKNIRFLSPHTVNDKNRINSISGFTEVDNKAYLFSSALITSTDGNMPIKGFMIFAKEIDFMLFSKIASKVNISVLSVNLSDYRNLDKYSHIITKVDASKSNYKYARIGNDYFMYYNDNRNNPLILLQLRPYNSIPQANMSFVQENILSLCTILIFMIFFQRIMKETIITPILDLNGHIKLLKEEECFRPMEYRNKNNEIDNVIHTFNSLIKMVGLKDKEIKETNKKLYFLANNDSLTKIANRRYFEEKAEIGLRMGKFYKKPISIIMLDIDRYKWFNDFYGHQKGDEVLKFVAKIIQRGVVNESDIVARYGGEEFILFLYDCDLDMATEISDKLINDFKNEAIIHEKSDIAKYITASFGICSLVPSEDVGLEKIVSTADDALYIAKRNGRNRYSFKKL